MSEFLHHLAIKGLRKPPEISLSDEPTTPGAFFQMLKYEIMAQVNYLRHETRQFVVLCGPKTLIEINHQLEKHGVWFLRNHIRVDEDINLEEGLVILYPEIEDLTVRQITEVIVSFIWES